MVEGKLNAVTEELRWRGRLKIVVGRLTRAKELQNMAEGLLNVVEG